MAPEPLSLAGWQTAFAARLRAPAAAPRPPGVPARRMRVYEDLLFNNLEGFLLACYPVTRKLLGARAWRRTARAFLREHRCHSPLFRDIPKAFLDWLEVRAAELFPAQPFLAELAHYEWLELAVSVAPDEVDPGSVDPEGDLLGARPAVNPTARLACYRYPVHRLGPRFRPTEPDTSEHCYLLFRAPDDGVRFLHLNALSAHLLARLADTCASGHAVLLGLAGPEPAPGFIAAGTDLLQRLRRAGALLGTWRTS